MRRMTDRSGAVKPGAAARPAGVEAVDRALALLRAFREGDAGLPLAELARRTGLYKSTILRLAASLERGGLLARGGDGRFRLGEELWRLGALYRGAFDLERVIRPALQRLVDATGETASFYVRAGDARACLYRVNSPKAVRHHLEEGVRLPLERGAAGRVLLAFAGAPGAVSARIRRAGEYVSLGERDPEIAAAAVPAFDAGGMLRGALAVSGLIARFDAPARKRALAALREAAAALRQRIPAAEPG